MEIQWKSIPCKFFGMRKEEVRTYVEDIIVSFEEQKRELESKISNASSERQRVRRELDELRSKGSPQKPDTEIVEVARRRLARSQAIIQRSCESEIMEIINAVNEKLDAYNPVIDRKKAEIEQVRQKIDSILEGFMHVLPAENTSVNKDSKGTDKDTQISDMQLEMNDNPPAISDKVTDADLDDFLKKVSEADPKPLLDLPESRALKEEICQIRHKYIVGKLAGSDLYDANGNLIIAKGTVISTEIITKAESEGKLSELIINMVLPGLE